MQTRRQKLYSKDSFIAGTKKHKTKLEWQPQVVELVVAPVAPWLPQVVKWLVDLVDGCLSRAPSGDN